MVELQFSKLATRVRFPSPAQMSDIDRQLQFAQEILALRTIKRRIYSETNDIENDAEHSWHLAMMVMIFGNKIDRTANLLRMLQLALVHDLVEIYAGDVWAFAPDKSGKEAKESEATTKLADLLPESEAIELKALLEEYQKKETIESKIVSSLDKIQPILMNIEFIGYSWRDTKITLEDFDAYKFPAVKWNPKTREIFNKLRKIVTDNNLLN